MIFTLPLFALLASCRHAQAQDPTPGNYSQPYRPQVHFSAPYGFMNDPNGLFKAADGTYHLYYQLNPTGLTGANQHWGHATSTDLYTWTNQAIAISPDSSSEQIWTGSAVIDVNNTSGFFPNQTDGVLAMYTLNTAAEEAQDIAYSNDGGFTYTKYTSNPVISLNLTSFRDPKVVWYDPTQSWVAVVSFANDDIIGIWTSTDLKEWINTSNFTQEGVTGLAYECPNFIPMPMLKNGSATDAGNLLDPSNFISNASYWIMWISTSSGGPAGGSISRYIAGTFNGTHFSPLDVDMRLTDFAMDNYAGQFFYNIPATEPPIGIQWAVNSAYANDLPTASEGFRGTMSLPRQYALANTTDTPYALIAAPLPLDGLYTTDQPLVQNTSLANSTLTYTYSTDVPSGALSVILIARNLATGDGGSMNFTFSSSSTGETLTGGALFAGDTLVFLDRSGLKGYTGNPIFAEQFNVTEPLDPDTGRFEMQVVVDRSIIEVFVDQGAKSATSVFFAQGALDTLELSTAGLAEGVTIEADVWGLKSTWS